MKIYKCKICDRMNKEFVSARHIVRKHLREEHGIRGKLKMDGAIVDSQLTANTIAVEI